MGKLSKNLTLTILFCVLISAPNLIESKECLDKIAVDSLLDIIKSESPEFIESESPELISIYNDQNFTDYGLSGTGTIADPYIIENITTYDFDYYNTIVVRNTSKHFVIRNCTIHAGSSGILIVDVADNTTTITNNTCYILPPALGTVGINVINSNGALITNNFCTREQPTITYEEGTFGIRICNANYCVIANNTMEKQDMSGILSESNENSLISGNNCSFNRVGLSLWNTVNNSVVNNTCEKNVGGMTIWESNAYVNNNYISSNERDGIWIGDSKDAFIVNNTIEYSGTYGINSKDSDRCKYTYNLIKNNTGYGVFLDLESRYNFVHHNYFIHNHIEGTSQAYDSGNNNTWHDTETKEGNFWIDLDKNSTYHINGKAENNDLYPLNENLERITKTNLHIPSIFFFIFVISLNKLRRKSKKK